MLFAGQNLYVHVSQFGRSGIRFLFSAVHGVAFLDANLSLEGT